MAEQLFTVQLSEDSGNALATKLNVVSSVSIVDPLQFDVAVGWAIGVSTSRQTEIMNGLQFLIDGIRDRHLLDTQFALSPLVSTVSMTRLTASNRRTASTVAAVAVGSTDILVTLGAGVTITHKNIIDTAFEQLLRAAQEFLKKV